MQEKLVLPIVTGNTGTAPVSTGIGASKPNERLHTAAVYLRYSGSSRPAIG